MTIAQREEIVRLAQLDVAEFNDDDAKLVLRRAEQRLAEAIQSEEEAGTYRRFIGRKFK
jgi:hypothetical protein